MDTECPIPMSVILFTFSCLSFSLSFPPVPVADVSPLPSAASALPVQPSFQLSMPSASPHTPHGCGHRHYGHAFCHRSMWASTVLPTSLGPFVRYNQCLAYASCPCMAGRWSSSASFAALQVAPAGPLFLSPGRSSPLPRPAWCR